MPKNITIPKNEMKNGAKRHKYSTQGIAAQTIELLESKLKRRQQRLSKLNSECREINDLLETIKLTLVDKIRYDRQDQRL